MYQLFDHLKTKKNMYCIQCKSKPATVRYKGTNVFLCSADCAHAHLPIYIGQKMPYQQPNIPPYEQRIILHTHREGVGSVPYQIATQRKIVQQMGGDVEAFDRALKKSIEVRRKVLLFVANVPSNLFVIDPIIRTETNKYHPTFKANVYIGHREIGESGIIPYLLNPFINNAEILEKSKQISAIMLNKNITVREKDENFRKFLLFVAQFDEFLSNWCFFQNTFYLRDYPDSVFKYNTSKPIHSMFKQAFWKLADRYTIPSNYLNFPKVPTNFGDLCIIPVGTFLYRGYADNLSTNGLSINREFDYFAFDFYTTSLYSRSNVASASVKDWLEQDSGVAVFQTTEEVRVLDLTKSENIQYLQEQMQENNAPEEVQSIIEWAWKITPCGKVERRSGPRSDAEVVAWICSMGWHGYIGVGFSGFHDEIMLCKPKQVLTMWNDYKHRHDFLNDLARVPTKEQEEAVICEY